MSLPIVMTRRMQHVFLRTPDHLSVDEGFRRAEVIGLGGDPALAAAVIATRLGHDFADRGFWRTVITWLIACRAAQGVGMAACVMCARAMLRDFYAPQEGARVLARAMVWMISWF